MSWARIHRWLAVVLVAFLVVWSVTGLLFHLKPGWSAAYEPLDGERGGALHVHELVSIDAIAAAHGGEWHGVELFDTALGPLYRMTAVDGGSTLYDATTGRARSPLGADDARTLALDAVARSAHRGRYGAIRRVEERTDAVRIHFAGGPVVDVGRADARLSQRGPDTDRIDWLYRIHYLQWTGHRAFDRMLAVAGLALIWAVMIPGIVLFVRRWRQHGRARRTIDGGGDAERRAERAQRDRG